jgi:hypothetical protein
MRDEDLDWLLAKGTLSGPERDRMFERVVKAARMQRSRSRARRASGAAAVALGLAAGVLLVARAHPNAHPTGSFTARGGATAGTAVEVFCAGGTLGACPRGARLLFGSVVHGYLAAYADRSGSGERIWYFGAGGESPLVGTGPREAPADRAILVGPEHAPGAYTLHVLVGSRPLSAAEALDPKSAAVVASGVVPLVVTP